MTATDRQSIGFLSGTPRRSRTRWPHCWRCAQRLGPHDDPDEVDELCRDCRDNFLDRASSYGGTKSEIRARYWDIVEHARRSR